MRCCLASVSLEECFHVEVVDRDNVLDFFHSFPLKEFNVFLKEEEGLFTRLEVDKCLDVQAMS